MQKKGYTIAEFLVTITILAIIVFIIISWLFNVPSRRQKPAAIKEGQPIIEAVYKYKNDKGVWPQQTKDFVPSYLKAMPNDLWDYREGHLIRKFYKSRCYIAYSFKDDQWNFGGESGSSPMDVKQSKPALQK